jgi:DNA primase
MYSKTLPKKTLDLNKVKSIVFEDIYKLLDSLNLEYTQDSDNIFMKCPIHEGSDNPNGLSFSIDKQIWKCWTRGCHEHYNSDIWGFVKGVLGTDSFSDVLKYICKIYNVNGASKVDDRNVRNTDSGDINSDFREIVRQIKRSRNEAKFNNENCDNSGFSTDGFPSPYFLSRGFKPETLRFFEIESVAHSDDRSLKNRAIIPIRDVHGSKIGYIARATRDFVTPKYIFSKGLKKTDHLYNYHNAFVGLARSQLDTLFLVEGQGDVWKLWECGVKNAVGLFGKDVSLQQRKLLLSSGATKLVILTDNDQAGRESKIKIKRDLGRLFKLIFPKMHTKDLGNMLVESVQETILKDLKGYY